MSASVPQRARSTPLVGRQAERQMLLDAVAARRRLVIVRGEAGAGKTRLLDEADGDSRAPEAELIRMRAVTSDQDTPFAVVRRGVPVGVPGPVSAAPEAESAPNARFRVFDALLDELSRRAAHRDVVVLLDDAHWADSGSLDLLTRVASDQEAGRVTIVLASRPATAADSHLSRLIDLARAGDAIIDLTPLHLADVIEMAGAQLGRPPGPRLVAQLQRCGGSPLIARELVRTVMDGGLVHDGDLVTDTVPHVTDTLSSVLLTGLFDIDDAAREVVRVASVIGSSFRPDEVAAVLESSPFDVLRACERLVSVGLIEPADDDRLRFRHDLVREAVYDDLPEWARAALHRQVAARLVATDAEPIAVVRHLDRAEPGAESGPWFRRAGLELLHTDPAAAGALLLEALRLEEEPPDELILGCVQSLAWTNRSTEAEALAREHLDADRRPLVHLALAQALVAHGRLAEAGEAIGRGGELLCNEGDVTRGQRALAESTIHQAMAFAHDQAIDSATELIDAEETERVARVFALCGRSWARTTTGIVDEGIADARAAVDLADDLPDALRGNPHLFLADALLTGERFEEFERFAIDARSMAARYGSIWSLPGLSAMATGMHARRGEWDRAIAESDAGISWARDTGNLMAMPWLLSLQAAALTWSAGPDEAEPMLVEAESLMDGSPRMGAEAVMWARALWFDAAGRTHEALPLLQLLWELMRGLGIDSRASTVAPELVRAALAADDDETASSVCTHLDSLDHQVRSTEPAQHYCRGLLERDATRIITAAAGYRSLGLRSEEALALADATLVELANDHVDAARTHAAATQALHRRLGAHGLAQRFDRRIPARVSGTFDEPVVQDTSRLEALSPAERRIADLVRAGRNNPEIAEQLFISRRTVESHLSHVYAKLGIRSRVELAVLVDTER